MISFAKNKSYRRREETVRAPIITLDEYTLKAEMREVVRETVGQVINGILDAQADELVNAGKYERTDERQAYRSGHLAYDAHTRPYLGYSRANQKLATH